MALDTSMIVSEKIPIIASERKTFEPLRPPSDLPPCSTFSAKTSTKILWWCFPCSWEDSATKREMETKFLQDIKIKFWIHRAQEYTGPMTRSEGQRGQRNKELLHLPYIFGIEYVSTMCLYLGAKASQLAGFLNLTLSEYRQFWLIF